MKPGAKKTFAGVLLIPFSALLALAARILCLHILGVLFDAWNLTDATFAYAPYWAQRLAGMSGTYADLCFLVFLTLPLFLFSRNKRISFSKKLLLYPALGMALSGLTVGIFLLTGSARMPKIRVFPYFDAFLLYALTDFFSVSALAFLARKAPGRLLSKAMPVRVIISILFQAAFWMLSKRSVFPVFIVNAFLSALVFSFWYEKTGSVFPEILLAFSMRFCTRFVFGFPDLGGAYPVSEPLLTGAMGGVSHSLLLSTYLLAYLIFIFYRFYYRKNDRKGDSYASK